MKTRTKPAHPLSPFCRASVCRLLPAEPRRILSLTSEELERAGANAAEIRRIVAAQRLAQFSAEFRICEGHRNSTPEIVSRTILQLLPQLPYLQHEEIWCLPVDRKHQPLRPYRGGQGTTGNCLVHPREMLAPAIEQRAESLFSVHNHPTGDLTPSDQDRDVWDRLERAGDLIGIPFNDHFIASRRGVYSYKLCGVIVSF